MTTASPGPKTAAERRAVVAAPLLRVAQPVVDASVVTSRAGRNLPVAIGVGLLLGAVVILSLFWVKAGFLLLATTAVTIGVWEIAQAMRGKGINPPVPPALLGCVGMLVAAYLAGEQALVVVFGLTVALVVIWRGSEGTSGAATDVSAGLLLAAYPSLLAGFSMLILAAPDGAWRAFTFLAVTVASDIGGYAVGVLAGRHAMAPSISPKKSWEGFAGSVAGCVVVGIACVTLALHGSWWAGAILGLLAAAGATLGDLCESALKRDLGVKDMSHILPGHGGLMDRLDSLIVNAPVVWAVLVLLVPAAA